MKTLILPIVFFVSVTIMNSATNAQNRSKEFFPIWGGDNIFYNGGSIENLKWGFIDVRGNVVIKPQFDKVGNFSEGLAKVRIGDKWGYINEAGEVVIQPRWREPTINSGYLPTTDDFHDGLAIVVENVVWKVISDSNYYFYTCGYINTKGEYVIQPKSREFCGRFSDGLARTLVDISSEEYKDKTKTGEWTGSYGFIDKMGGWAIKPKFFMATDFRNGRAEVFLDWKDKQAGKKPLFIDTRGNTVESVTEDWSLIKARQDKLKEGLVADYYLFRVPFDIGKRPSIVTGYKNEKGKYVWLAPGAEKHLSKGWIKRNYIGTQKLD